MRAPRTCIEHLAARVVLSASVSNDAFYPTPNIDPTGLPSTAPPYAIAGGPDGGTFAYVPKKQAVLHCGPDGSIDTSYGTAGYAPIFTSPASITYSVKLVKALVRDDGELIMAMNVTDNPGSAPAPTRYALVAFTPNGVLDPTFGNGGWVFGQVPGQRWMYLNDIALQSDGHIVLTAESIYGEPAPTVSILARYDVQGTQTLATTYTDGTVVTRIAVASDDRFYLCAGLGTVSAYLAFDSSGSPRTSFGTNGRAAAVNTFDAVDDFLIAPDDSKLIAIGGYTSVDVQVTDAVTGQPDLNTGPNGQRTLAPQNPTAGVVRLTRGVFDAAGRLVIGYAITRGYAFAVLSDEGIALSTVPDSTVNPYSSPPTSILALQRADGDGRVRMVIDGRVQAEQAFDQPTAQYLPGEHRLYVRGADYTSTVAISRDGVYLDVRLNGATTQFPLADLSVVTIADGESAADITIGDTAGLPVKVQPNGGDDHIRFAADANAAAITIVGSDGATRVEVPYPLFDSRFAFDGGTVAGIYDDTAIDSILVYGGDGDDTIQIGNTVATAPGPTLTRLNELDIDGGGGNDAIDMVRTILGVTLSVDGGPGNDAIHFRGLLTNVNGGTQPPSTLRGGAGEDTFYLHGGTQTVFVNGGDDADSPGPPSVDHLHVVNDLRGTLSVTAAGDLSLTDSSGGGRNLLVTPTGIEDYVYDGNATNKSDTLRVADSARTVATAYTIAGNTFTWPASGITFTYSGVDFLSIAPGTADDTITATGIDPTLEVMIDTSGGNDLFVYDHSARATAESFTILGQGLQVNGTMGAIVNVEQAVLRSGSGNDTFTDSVNAGPAWTVNGGAGDDSLALTLNTATDTAQSSGSTPGDGQIAFGNRPTLTYQSIEHVAIPWPSFTAVALDMTRDAIRMTTSSTLATATITPAPGAITLTNRTTGQVFRGADLRIQTSGTTMYIGLAGGRLTQAYPGSAVVPLLPDGSYRLQIADGALVDGQRNAIRPAVVTDFSVLRGDGNRDGVVDFADLLTLGHDYGLSSRNASDPYAFADYDFNGKVDFGDLLILARSYGKSAVPAAPQAADANDDVDTTAVARRRTTPGLVATIV